METKLEDFKGKSNKTYKNKILKNSQIIFIEAKLKDLKGKPNKTCIQTKKKQLLVLGAGYRDVRVQYYTYIELYACTVVQSYICITRRQSATQSQHTVTGGDTTTRSGVLHVGMLRVRSRGPCIACGQYQRPLHPLEQHARQAKQAALLARQMVY